MDTSLEDRRINWGLIVLYALCAELVPIIVNLLYVFVWGNLINDYNLRFNDAYMTDLGSMIFLSVGFLSYAGTAFWISKRSRTRTMYNGFRLVLAGIVFELLFYWIIGVSFELRYAFSFLTYLIAVILATLTPPILKGKQTHLKDWDSRKDKEYHEKKRK
jgi:hypothetical protein